MLLSIVFGRFCNTQAGGLQPERQQYLRRNVKDPVQRIGRGLHSGRYRQVAQSYAYITAKKEYQSRRKKPVLTGAPVSWGSRKDCLHPVIRTAPRTFTDSCENEKSAGTT